MPNFKWTKAVCFTLLFHSQFILFHIEMSTFLPKLFVFFKTICGRPFVVKTFSCPGRIQTESRGFLVLCCISLSEVREGWIDRKFESEILRRFKCAETSAFSLNSLKNVQHLGGALVFLHYVHVLVE